MLSARVLGQHGAATRVAGRNLQLLSTANGFRARYRCRSLEKWSGLQGARLASTVEAGESKTGHIHTGPNEGIFFLDNIFPLKLQWLLRIPFVNTDKSINSYLKRLNNPQLSQMDPMNIVKRALPKSLPVHVNEIIPRVKEGGAYVRFSHEPHLDVKEIEGTLIDFLKDNPVIPMYSPWRRVRSFLVRGVPWVEDLRRFPSQRVKVEFAPASAGGEMNELSQEQLFALFRRYGKIADIVSQPADSKIVPRYATITFKLTRHAVMAKNCMHGFTLPEAEGGGKSGTALRIGYERIIKAHWIRDWLSSHPRVVIPILAAILATIAVAIFDPIRTFFIKAHVNKTFHVEERYVYKWIKALVMRADIVFNSGNSRKTESKSMDAVWDGRKGNVEQIQTWLMETADTFIVVQGPRGSGKKEVVEHALKGRNHTLVIDCKPIQEARGDSGTIAAAAKQVGYRPVFSWMNSVSSLIDLAAQGTIGTKTGFSETVDAQIAKIFENTATALQQIALESRNKKDKDANLGNDEYLEAHPELRPVVVIDNFLHKNNEGSVVYDKVSEWAAAITTANIAHVIFLTHDVSFSKSLSKALPDRVFRQMTLGDCPPEAAKQFVLRHLDADWETEESGKEEKKRPGRPSQRRGDLKELDDCIETLGGRLTDLEFLARRIKTGESPKKAVEEIIEQSASEILKMYILDTDRANRGWTAQEAWYLVKALSKADTIRYNEVLLDDTFKTGGGDRTLQALEQGELISIVSANGRPHSIKAGKPVYTAAFSHLTADHVLQARLDLATLAELIKLETQSVDKCEAELGLLGSLPRQPLELTDRVKWLLAKLQASHAKVEKYERMSGRLKKVLQKEF